VTWLPADEQKRERVYFGFMLVVAVALSAATSLLPMQWFLHPNTGFGLDVYNSVAVQRFIVAFMAFGTLGAPITAFVLFGMKDTFVKIATWLMWAFMPPLWFVNEYFFVFPACGNPAHFDHFKYGQDVSGKLWAVGVTVVSAVLYKQLKLEELRAAEASVSQRARS
jgi:hypothetical protein